MTLPFPAAGLRATLTAALLATLSTTSQAVVTATPNAVDLGTIEVGQTGTARFTLGNVGTPVETWFSVGPGPNQSGDYNASWGNPGGCAFPTADSCVFEIRLTPNAPGPLVGSMAFGVVGRADPVVVTYTATAVPAGTAPVAVPTMGAVGLGALSLVLGAAGWVAARRRQRQG